MKVPASAAFGRQRGRFSLRFTCEECAHFERASGTCSFTYPTAEHRDAFYTGDFPFVVFCKAFELE